MKRIILTIALAILAVPFVSAQDTESVTFLGIDFSAVNVMYAKESQAEFIPKFEQINILMETEPEKYDFSKYLNIGIKERELKYAIKKVATLQTRDFTDFDKEEISNESVIESYPAIEGRALIIIAKELNKAEAIGIYEIVVFDGTTKEIIKTDSLIGEAGGLGLRNFWAGSIYDGLKRYKKNAKKRR